MGNFLTDYEQVTEDAENGNEVCEAAEDCLRNPIIVRNILENFSTPDLLKRSFVNKLWNYEAREVARKRGRFTAYVKSDDLHPHHQREEVDAFISDLREMNPVPYSGISIDIYFEPEFGPFPLPGQHVDPDPLQGVVLEQSPLKTVSVKLRGSWLDNLVSPGFLLIRKVLQDCSGDLEELELNIENGQGDFIEKVFQDVSFPQLKILKLRESYQRSQEGGYENYVKALLSRAPILNVLHINWSKNLMLRVLNGTSVVPVYGSRVDAPFEEISEDDMSAIRLESMKLVYTGFRFDFERFNRITPMLLRTSCTTTLRYMWLDPVLAVPLMCYGICLEKVKHLTMEINYRHLDRTEPRILSIVNDFDFARIFPNLSKVDIVDSKYSSRVTLNHMDGIIEQAEAVLTEPTLDRAATVKAMHLHQGDLSREAIQFFAQMFPNVQALEITIVAAAAGQISFESIWENWRDLKELKIRGNMLPAAGNLDSVFCGIFPEEVAELRLKNEKYLTKVNIVPVMPALTCLKNLRVLHLNHVQPLHSPFSDNGTFLFSKVTSLLSFARCPAVSFSLNVSSHSPFAVLPAMAHLEPYASTWPS